jgi:hypothetical protein
MKLGKITGFLIDGHRRQLLRKTDGVRFEAMSSLLYAVAVRESKDKQISPEEVGAIG